MVDLIARCGTSGTEVGNTSGIGVDNFGVANTCVGAESGPNVAESGGNDSLSTSVIDGSACLSVSAAISTGAIV
jgi:hypothetical protein